MCRGKDDFFYFNANIKIMAKKRFTVIVFFWDKRFKPRKYRNVTDMLQLATWCDNNVSHPSAMNVYDSRTRIFIEQIRFLENRNLYITYSPGNLN